MKWFKYLLMATMFIVPSMTMVSCSEKDDEPEIPEIPEIPGNVEVGWVDKGNTVEFTISHSYGYGYDYMVTYVCKFDESGLCYNVIANYQFESKDIADAYYAQAAQTYDDVKQNGKVVIIDETNSFIGMTKDELYQVYVSLQSYNSMN